MQNRTKFNLVTLLPGGLFFIVQFFSLQYLIKPSRGDLFRILPYYGIIAVFCLGIFYVIIRNFRKLALTDISEIRDNNEVFSDYLNNIGAVPIRTLLLSMLTMVIAQVLFQFVYSFRLMIPPAVLLSFAGLMIGYGFLAAGFTFVSLDHYIMEFLYSQKVEHFPLEKVAARQKSKNITVPLFIMVITLLATLFLSLLMLHNAPLTTRGNDTAIFQYLIIQVLPSILFFSTIVLFLVMSWAKNNASLHKLITNRLEDMVSHDKNLTRRIYISSVDELSVISRHVNEFSNMIAEYIRETGKVYGKLDNNQKELSLCVDESSSAIGEISSLLDKTIDSVASVDRIVKENRITGKSLAENVAKTVAGVEGQSASVAESSAAVEQMIASISEVTRRTGNVRENTDNLVNSFQDGEDRVNKTITSISGVAELSEGLMGINQLISGIAARTNLLAMNAAIEAAHAGDAGRGFSVVADEIRKLAENTASHTKSSSENLTRILDEIQISLKAAKSTGISFRGMKEGVLHIQDETLSIAESMSEHDRTNREVLKQLTHTRELAENLDQVAQILTNQSNSLIDDLKVLDDESDVSLEYGAEMKEKNNLVKKGLEQLQNVSSVTQDLNRQTRVMIESFKV